MIETNNPEINVNDLMEQVRAEVAKRNSPILQAKKSNPAKFINNSLDVKLLNIQALINNAEDRSQARTKWPEKLNKFPLNISKKLQQIILKSLNFLFKEQRVVNLSLVQAGRESLEINRELIKQIISLQERINYTEACLIDKKTELQKIAEENYPIVDEIYVAFEDRFRGSRVEISDRLKVYLPILAATNVGTEDTPILDLGCGRGEWLNLLRESKYIARGLDINKIMIEQSVAQGLEAIQTDAITYLQSLSNNCLGAVTGFHIIEHLNLPTLIELISQTARVLKPGGLAIFETPNPKNLVVGACNFYSDPTHKNPVFPETIQFFLQYKGLTNVEILYLNPVKDSSFKQVDTKWDILDNWFFGARDYAVIGHKI